MIKLTYVAVAGAFFLVFAFAIYGIVMDMGLYIYELGILQYPPTIVPIMMFIYFYVYPNLPLICIALFTVLAISYGLYKRYT